MECYRPNRFYELGPQDFNFRKIGWYQRTAFYEHHLRSLQITLAQIRQILQNEISKSALFRSSWERSEILYLGKRAAYPQKIFSACPKEYYISIICFSLPKMYEDFTRQCTLLWSKDIDWNEFNYQALFYLLFQAELRMKIPNQEIVINDRNYLKTYRCLGPHISVDDIRERDLVAFSQVTPTTRDQKMALDGLTMTGGTLLEIERLRLRK